MKISSYRDADAFLAKAQPVLEQKEAENSLILGVGSVLTRHPERASMAAYMATVEDEDGKPVLAALQTPPYKLTLAYNTPDCGEALELVARDIKGEGFMLPGVSGPENIAGDFARVWNSLTGQGYEPGMRMRIYQLSEVTFPTGVPGHLRVATEEDLELAMEWSVAFQKDTHVDEGKDIAIKSAVSKVEERHLYLWEDGQVVSMAAKARPSPHGMAVNLVYTPPELRGRGYASACVAALSQLQLDSGWQFCTLFTDLSNPTSNSIYQKIGYRPVCDFNEYIFR